MTEPTSSGPILPPLEEEKEESLTLRVPLSFLGTLNAIAKFSGHKRHRVALTFVKWAAQEWEKHHPEFGEWRAANPAVANRLGREPEK